VVALFVSLRIIRLRQMAAICRQAFGEFLLIIATWAAVVAAPIEQWHGIWSVTRAHAIVFERIPAHPFGGRSHRDIAQHRRVGVPRAAVVPQCLSFSLRRSGGLAQCPGAGAARVLKASAIIEIDFTGAQVLRDYPPLPKGAHCFALARLESIPAQETVNWFGIGAQLGSDRLFHIDEALPTQWKRSP
jgi:sulfate permease, SulP family